MRLNILFAMLSVAAVSAASTTAPKSTGLARQGSLGQQSNRRNPQVGARRGTGLSRAATPMGILVMLLALFGMMASRNMPMEQSQDGASGNSQLMDYLGKFQSNLQTITNQYLTPTQEVRFYDPSFEVTDWVKPVIEEASSATLASQYFDHSKLGVVQPEKTTSQFTRDDWIELAKEYARRHNLKKFDPKMLTDAYELEKIAIARGTKASLFYYPFLLEVAARLGTKLLHTQTVLENTVYGYNRDQLIEEECATLMQMHCFWQVNHDHKLPFTLAVAKNPFISDVDVTNVALQEARGLQYVNIEVINELKKLGRTATAEALKQTLKYIEIGKVQYKLR